MNGPLAWSYAVRQGPAGIDALRRAMLHALQPHGLDARCIYALELVLEEWLSNVARHGGHPDALVRVQAEVGVDDVRLRFEDDGRPFDPGLRPDPQPAATLDEAQPGGLGLAMMRRLAQTMDYRRIDDRNVLMVALPRGATGAMRMA